MKINSNEKNEMNEKEFKDLLKQVEKEFGKGSIIKLDDSISEGVEVISSGSLLVDKALGVKGFPKGRIVEIYGPESSGKTTLALTTIAEANKENDKMAAFIDAEHALDINHVKKMGVNLDKIIISQPDSGEQALEIVEYLLNTDKFNIIVVDSVAALTPKAEIEGNISDITIGGQARMMSKALRRLSPLVNKKNVVLIFINQVREKVGVIFGNPEITPGGRALKFYSSIRMDVRIKERIKRKDEIVGQKIRVKIVKNKLSSPYKEAEILLEYENGIDKIIELIDLAFEKDIVKKSGSWYFYGEQKLGQGKLEAKKRLIKLGLVDEINNKLNNV